MIPAPAISWADGHSSELHRWLDGRHDWQDDRWQDHCGDVDCAVCDGFIPSGSPRAASARSEAFKRGWPLPDAIARTTQQGG
jgi:uncharacterized protein CbrC (UPF0167 family)